MIDFSSLGSWLTILGALLSGIGACFVGIRKILANIEKSKKHNNNILLQAAKEYDETIKHTLESRLHDLEVKDKNNKENADKDIEHIREIYSTEIKMLGDKIENLRQELREQSTSILALLTKMISKD